MPTLDGRRFWLAGIGGMVWYFASQPRVEAEDLLPDSDPLLGLRPTPSQRATVKFFFVVAALWVVQVALGAITAHYGVEGSGFYGIPLDRWLPYAVTRTWHLQIGIFWIATSWLATGLYIVPAVSGIEPKGQRLGVNALFIAVVAVVVGSLAGEWLGIQQKLGNLWFWFGSQGYEYVDLGRVWLLVFGIGAGLAGLAGILAGPMRPVYPEMGITMVIESFVVVVVGGMGSLLGAVVAGIIIGEVVSLTTFFAPKLSEIMVFVVMALVLLVRPSGLFGEAGLLE